MTKLDGHLNMSLNPLNFLKQKFQELLSKKRTIELACIEIGQCWSGPYHEAAKLNAKMWKAHIIGDNLILPAAKKIVDVMLEEWYF